MTLAKIMFYRFRIWYHTGLLDIAEWLKRGSADDVDARRCRGPASRRPLSMMVLGAL